MEFARSLGINVAINLIADPDWDEARFATVRQWCMDVPEIVNISVNTPYPGTETWMTEQRHLTSRDYRLLDIQHCVLPTKLPLERFYRELIETQRVLYMKHLGWRTLWDTAGIVGGHLLHGQTNFLKSLFRFNNVYDPAKLLADHAMPVRYEVPLPSPTPDAKLRNHLRARRPQPGRPRARWQHRTIRDRNRCADVRRQKLAGATTRHARRRDIPPLSLMKARMSLFITRG